LVSSAFCLLLAVACSGEIAAPSGSPPAGTGPGGGDRPWTPGGGPAAGSGGDETVPGSCETGPAMLGQIPVRRLSRVEHQNTVEDLLYGMVLGMPELPKDPVESGFENSARLLSAPPLWVEQSELIASQAAQAALADPATRAQILPCKSWTTPAEQTTCAEAFLSGFGARAFRRPLTADERQSYLAFIDEVSAEIDFEAAIELAVAALMQAPQFTYRLELGAGDGRVTAYELASRLSYLLWQSMPDETLMAAAAANQLATPAQLEAQARRMLREPRARQAMVDFHRQWLDFDRVLEEPKEPGAFPDWGPELRAAIREEVDRFVAGVMLDGDGTLASLLTSRKSWVDAELAEHYGLPPVSKWTQVELPANERSGILTRSDFLAGQAHETNGSPVLRGVFVIDRLLCAGLDAPPASADTSTPQRAPGSGPITNRTLFEQRTAPQQCQGCHVQINGIGFGFEHFDAAGAFRTRDDTLPVDASGTIVGTDVDGPYDGAVELSERLAHSNTVHDCAASHWLRYTLGRRIETADACLQDRAERALAASGGDVRELLIEIVTSPEFARGPE
jgi:hypothetical protein